MKVEEVKMKVQVRREVTNPKDHESLWEIYDQVFSSADSPHEQRNYSLEEFIEALKDPEYIKFILYQGGIIIGFCLVTINLTKAPWVSPQFFEKWYPDYYEKKSIFYVTVIALRSEYAGSVRYLVKEMTKYVEKQNGMVAFDYSERKNKLLPELVTRVVKSQIPEAKAEVIDKEIYFVLRK